MTLPTPPPVITSCELPGVPVFRSGKVREVFDFGDCYLIVATDRLSAFDCILPTGIPFKGHVLTQLAAWWFNRLAGVVTNHFISLDPEDWPEPAREAREQLEGRSMLVRKAEPLPVECVARGYLIGSGWKEYQATRSVCGLPLREGYRMADPLDEPIFTPATKAESGHDENIPFEQMAEVVGAGPAAAMREATMRLYHEARTYAAGQGILIADTKFEFGTVDGQLLLIDEALTPDSSRFWPADAYAPGTSPPSYDKQYVRDYLESLDWDKTPPAPALPDHVVRQTSEKYVEAFHTLTGAWPAC